MTDDSFFAGDDGEIEFTVYQADGSTELDLTDMTIEWALGTGTTDPALLTKSTANTGEITVVNATGGRFDVVLVPGDTDTLGGKAYYHEVELTDVNGKQFTVFSGYLAIEETLVA